MKKFLRTAAIALAGILSPWTESANAQTYVFGGEKTAVAELTDGGIYFIYDTYNGRNAMRYVNENGRICGNANKDVNAEYDAAYAWKAIADGENWKFQSLSNSKYIPRAESNQGTVYVNTTAGTFTLESAGNNTFYVTNTGTNIRWDGTDGIRVMSQWNASNHAHEFYVAVATKDTYDVTLTVNYGDGKSFVKSLGKVDGGETYTAPAYDSSVMTVTGWTNGETVTGDINLVATLVDGVKPFKFNCLRYLNKWATTSDNGLAAAAQSYDAGEYFFEVPIGNDNFKIYSLERAKWVGSAGDNISTIPFNDETPGEFQVLKHASGAEAVGRAGIGSGTQGFLNWRSASSIGTWSAGNDAGSHWFMVYDNTNYQANLTAAGITIGGDYGDIQGGSTYQTTIAPAIATALAGAEEVYAKIANYEDSEVAGKAELRAAIEAASDIRLGKSINIATLAETLTAAAEAIDLSALTFTVTLTFPEYEGYTYSVEVADAYINATVANVAPEVSFFTFGDNTTVVEPNGTYVVNGTWAFPIEFKTLYRAKATAGTNGDFYYFYYNQETNRIESKNSTNAEVMADERLFYFNNGGGFDANGHLKVTLHNAIDDDTKGFTVATGSNNDGSFTETPTIFLVVTNSTNGGAGISLRHSESATTHVNPFQGNSILGAWNHSNSQNDNGSSIKFYNVAEEYETILSNGNAFAAIGVATAEATNAWNEVAAATEFSCANYNTAYDAFQTLVNSSRETDGGVYVKMEHPQNEGDLMCVRFNAAYGTTVGRYGNDVNVNKTTWKIEATDTVGFKLYNVYSAKYLKMIINANNQNCLAVDKDDASVFVFDIFDALEGLYGIKCIQPGVEAAREYLHSNGGNTIVRWAKGRNSSWYLYAATAEDVDGDEEAINQELIVPTWATIDLIGEKVCQYYPTEETEALQAETEDALASGDRKAIYDAKVALEANLATLDINMPEDGKTYLIGGYEGGYYIAPTSASGQMAMSKDVANNKNALFKFEQVYNTTNSFVVTNVGHGNVGINGTHSLGSGTPEELTFTKSEGGKLGAYTIKTNYSGSKYLYNNYDKNGGPVADRNGAYANRCNWILEEVEDPEDFTGIEEVETAPVQQGIYDLQGRRLSTPVKGINIINGKKVLVK
jgi:hypothetical protein